MVKAIVGLTNVMGMVFNCNVAQGYNGTRPANPMILQLTRILEIMMSFYLILKIYIPRSYNEFSKFYIISYKTQTLKLVPYSAKICFKDPSLSNTKLFVYFNSNFTYFLLIWFM
jgi:hypothetical protein